MTWQLQEAKQRFSELVRRAEADGPQVVTRHGEEIAVVLSMSEYRRVSDPGPGFKAFLTSGPDLDGLVLDRSADRARPVDLSDG
jgi:prevent-host-death family protein